MQANFADEEEDGEELICIYTSKQLKDLLKIAQVQNRDYNPLATMALQNGKVTSFMGFTFIPPKSARRRPTRWHRGLTVDGSGYRRVPFFSSRGCIGASGATRSLPASASAPTRTMRCRSTPRPAGGMTRVNEDKCYQMLCLES
jgi:hypothetical protein